MEPAVRREERTDRVPVGANQQCYESLHCSRSEYTLKLGNQCVHLRGPPGKPHKQILPGKLGLVTPEPLAKKTPSTISVDGARKITFGYDQAQAGVIAPVWPTVDEN